MKQAGHRPGMAQFWLDQFIRVEYDAISQRDDSDHNLGHDYGNDCDLDHMQDIVTSNDHDVDE